MPTASPRWRYLAVKSEPLVDDPRELKTILVFSLKSLWGELETHSYLLEVEKNESALVIRCPSESVSAVRAALTLPAPPPYLESTLYRFDVSEIQMRS